MTPFDEIAAAGPFALGEQDRVTETDIALGEDSFGNPVAMVVYITGRDGPPNRIGWSLRDGTGQWQPSGTPLPRGGMIGRTVQRSDGTSYLAAAMGDPSVAFNSADNAFICAANAQVPGGNGDIATVVCHFTSSPPSWSDWIELSVSTSQLTLRDKAFIVSGDGDEFYVTYLIGSQSFGVSWTDNGGAAFADWQVVDPITVGGATLTGGFAMQPACLPGSPLFIAYSHQPRKYRFLKGTHNQTTGALEFSQLMTGVNATTVDTNKPNRELAEEIPCLTIQNKTTCQLAIDPSNPKRLYVAYHDSKGPNQPELNDVNTYVQTLDARGADWVLGPRRKIHANPALTTCTSPADIESDQFLPAITVDQVGRVHVLYYEDALYCQPDGITATAGQRFDLSYAVSCDGAQSWVNTRLTPDSSALDASFVDFSTGPLMHNGPKEYMGADFWFDGETTHVWFSFTGISFLDLDDDESVIWALPIYW